MRKLFENINYIVLRQRRYKVMLGTRIGSKKSYLWGYCLDPKKPHPKISYHVSLKEKMRLEMLIHEMLHACLWDMSEESIEFAANDFAQALWRIGYRLPDDEKVKDNRSPKYFVIRGKRYLYKRTPHTPNNAQGCVSAPFVKNKKITIHSSLNGEEELAAILKYMIYAYYWDLDSEAVTEISRDIARVLYKIGYTKQRQK